MTGQKVEAPTSRRRQIVVRIATVVAVLGGLLAAAGYVWVAEVSAAFMNALAPSAWSNVPTRPGIVAFIAGSIVLIGALLTIRLTLRPRIGGHLIWASVWLAWVAVALTCFGMALNTDAWGGIGEVTLGWGVLVGLLALLVFVFGLRMIVAERSKDNRAVH